MSYKYNAISGNFDKTNDDGIFSTKLTVTNASASGTPGSASQVNTGDPNTKGLIIKGNTYNTTAIQPNSISGLKLWLKADSLSLNDGDAVTTWSDSSVNGYDCTQGTGANKPLYKTNILGAYPALLFDGTNDTLRNTTFTGLGTSDFSMFVVASSSITSNKILFFLANNGGSNGASFALKTNTSDQYVYGDWGNGTVLTVTSPTITNNVFSLVEGKQVHGTNTFSSYINGTATTAATTDSTSLNLTENGYWLGSDRATGLYWTGYIAEVIIYDSALSTGNRQGIEAYISAKYGISVASSVMQTSNFMEIQNSAGGVLSYVNPSGYLFSPKAISTITSNTTLDNTYYTVLANAAGGAITVTLPAAATCSGREYVIKKIDNSNNVVIDGFASETIDGATTKTLTTQYETAAIQCNGTAWFVIN